MKYTSNPIMFKSIKEMPAQERPREKMERNGSQSLSDLELVCSILGSGCKARPVQDIAYDVLERIALGDSLDGIEGLGKAQKSVIRASLELGRRMNHNCSRLVKDANQAYRYISHYGDRKQEHFICILLNGALELIEYKVITIGLVNKTMVHPREVFAYAIENRATSVIIAHNHPSGNLTPSEEDFEVTSSLKKAGDCLGIQLVDHIIFNEENYFSLKESGMFFFP